MSNDRRDSAKRVQEALHQYNIDAKVVEFKELPALPKKLPIRLDVKLAK
jgi:hypothetical protein